MENSPLQYLCADISSIIADYIPIFKRKKFWEDLSDNVKKKVFTKSLDGNNIPAEIILSNLDIHNGLEFLNKIDNIYLDMAFGIYYINDHFISIFKSEYWETPDDSDVCDYSDGKMNNIKLKEGISFDMIPKYNELMNKFNLFNSKLLFNLPENIGSDNLLRKIVHNNNLEEGHKYLCNTEYINNIIKKKNIDEFKNKLLKNDKDLIIEHLKNWESIYITLQDLGQDKINNINDYDENEKYYYKIVSECKEKTYDINNLIKGIQDF